MNKVRPVCERELGREIKQRYGLADNVTQQDGLFVTENSIVGVELKLESKSSADQIMKYAALMVLEEKYLNKSLQLGLMFIVPQKAVSRHWQSVQLETPSINASYLDRLDGERLNRKVAAMLTKNRAAFASVLDRLSLSVITWADFWESLASIQQSLDCARCGDQTAFRLLAGLRAQISTHKGTGLQAESTA
jgi:hypothetical protein